MRSALALLGLATLAACGGSTATSPSSAGDPNLAFCVQETNRYRAMAGRPALAQSSAIEAFAAAAAAADAQSGVPHGYFDTHAQGTAAENEALKWPVANFGSVQGTMAAAIAAFWNEGPSGGHYQNLVGPYSQLGCGLYQSGQVLTFVQDFR